MRKTSGIVPIQLKVVTNTAVDAYPSSRPYCVAIMLDVVIDGAPAISIRIRLSVIGRKCDDTKNTKAGMTISLAATIIEIFLSSDNPGFFKKQIVHPR